MQVVTGSNLDRPSERAERGRTWHELHGMLALVTNRFDCQCQTGLQSRELRHSQNTWSTWTFRMPADRVNAADAANTLYLITAAASATISSYGPGKQLIIPTFLLSVWHQKPLRLTCLIFSVTIFERLNRGIPQTYSHAPSGLQTQDPSVRATEDGTQLRTLPLAHCNHVHFMCRSRVYCSQTRRWFVLRMRHMHIHNMYVVKDELLLSNLKAFAQSTRLIHALRNACCSRPVRTSSSPPAPRRTRPLLSWDNLVICGIYVDGTRM